MRGKWSLAAAALGLAAVAPFPASAGLLGAGNTVQPTFLYVVNGVPGAESPANHATGTNLPASLAVPVSYDQGAQSGSSIAVADTTITITNRLNAPFCFSSNNTGSACADPIDTFDFKFTGENILGVSIDPASDPAFLPATFGTHLGLQLLSSNELSVDVTGDAPPVSGSLILDLSFTPVVTPPTGIPEPAGMALFGVSVGGIVAARRRHARAV